MRARRLTLHVLLPVVLATAAPGCAMFHVYRPVTVLVRDAETKKPIPGAEVSLAYMTIFDFFAPSPSADVTGADGIAHLVTAPYDRGPPIAICADAKGYCSETYTAEGKDIRVIDTRDWFKDSRPISLVLEKQPRPMVELIIPNGYRGILKAEVKTLGENQGTLGQRRFSFQVPPSGIVEVAGPRVLRNCYPADYILRYADGTHWNTR
jgi:hypothetical protein